MQRGYWLQVLVMACLFATHQQSTSIAQTGFTTSQLEAIKQGYKRPPTRPIENRALVELGRELFFEKALSASGNTACVSCHLPELGWGVAEAKSRTDSGKLTSRRSQSLLGGYPDGTGIGWDGRNATLEAQAKSSIVSGSMSMNQTPTPVKVELIEERIRSNPAYAGRFKSAMPGAAIDIDTIVHAIAAFERTLEPDIAPFDRWIEGDESAISESAKRGFALFNEKALCFACHRGYRFTDDLFHDIGTTTTDQGRGRVLKDEAQAQYAFKTPTLRSIALRPPYMHNGSSATLDEAMRHYERGGIDRPSRSPLMQPIQLTDQERHDLIAFMETLTAPVHASSVGGRN